MSTHLPAAEQNTLRCQQDPIVFDDVSVVFGDNVVLSKLNATLDKGIIHVLLGPSGIGKTTLLRLLLELELPSEGELHGIAAMHKAAVFQEQRLAENLSALANVRLAADCSVEDARHLLVRLGLGGELSKPVRELSGGQAQRVALARAALAKGELVCMDEPLSGLDSQTKTLCVRELLPYFAGCTIIWVTHDQSDIELLGEVHLWEFRGSSGATMVRVS